ncbi:MAG: alanine racemase [Clostridia bacterium]|nr:alanine racemase [Clostridia bacterium]
MNQADYAKIHRTYAEIDLDAIRENGRIAKAAFPRQNILFVMKADAYGHGIEGILPAAETFADEYAVATVEEGLAVRKGSEKPILLFGPVPEGKMALAAQNGLSFTVGSAEYAERLSDQLRRNGLSADCQLKIDTGLNRSGVRFWGENEGLSELRAIYSHENLRFRGTYTHFACGEGADGWERKFTTLQFERFSKALQMMEREGFPIGVRHCTSTGGSLVRTEYRMDMVRLGMLPLGMSYSNESVCSLGLSSVMTWKSFVAQIKHLEAGDAVSYGCTFRAEKPMRIGLVTCGYADGYRRAYSGKAEALVQGRRVRVLGRIAMDYMMIDLSDIPSAQLGEAVTLLGKDGDEWISAQEISEWGESVSGEVTAAISHRVPRIYENK